MELGDVLRAVARRWWLLLGGILLGFAVAAVLIWRAVPLFASTVHFVVSTPDRSDIDEAYLGELYAQQRTGSFAQALRSEQLAERVVDELDLDLTASEMARKVTATVVPGTVVIELTVTDSSAARAQAVAGALEGQFARWVAAAEAPVDPVRAGAEVVEVTATALDTRQVSPDADLTLGLGGSMGLLLGLGLTVLAAPSRRAVRTDEEVRRLTGAPLLGSVPVPARPSSAADPEHSATADTFRTLQANLQLSHRAGLPRVVVVTATVRADGGAAVALGLTEALAQIGRRVALVEGDLEAAELEPAQWSPGVAGLGDVLTGAVPLPAATGQGPDGRFSVVAAGSGLPEAADLLGSSRMSAVLEGLLATHDHVVVHAPPLDISGDAVLLGGLADGCLLAARYGETRPGRLVDAADLLAHGGARLLGVVLTGVPPEAGVVRTPGHRYVADDDRGGAVAARRTVRAADAGRRRRSHV